MSKPNPKHGGTATPKHGGVRRGAGRKRSRARLLDPKHSTRPSLDYRHPVHVMLRTRQGVPKLRQRRVYHALRWVLLALLGDESFRVVHISIQRNHLHLIVEARNEEALSRGMQRFAIRAARGINAACDRVGKVFKFRYCAKQIRDRRYARNVLAYVLNNFRRHQEDYTSADGAVFDRYSSASSFVGWTRPPPASVLDGLPLPVAPPRTGLLKSSWRWYGLIDPFERPGPLDE
jgi:REP element-mobilizing transposase RayT